MKTATNVPRLALFLILAIFIPLRCERATGASQDPMDREAEDALVSYLRIDTSNPPGNETAGARFLQQLFATEGIETRMVGSNPARQSIYARLNSGTTEKALLLLHHIDVVPVAMNEWTKPPFSGLRSNGYIWGRGALDIKSLGIAEAMAMIDLKRRQLLNEEKLNYELNIGARKFKCTSIPIKRKDFGIVGGICINVDVNYLTDEIGRASCRERV